MAGAVHNLAMRISDSARQCVCTWTLLFSSGWLAVRGMGSIVSTDGSLGVGHYLNANYKLFARRAVSFRNGNDCVRTDVASPGFGSSDFRELRPKREKRELNTRQWTHFIRALFLRCAGYGSSRFMSSHLHTLLLAGFYGNARTSSRRGLAVL